MTETTRLDGSAAAGFLGELFAFEITLASAECRQCQAAVAVGEMHVYALEMGAVLRCPGCDAAIMRIGNCGGERWIDASGMRRMRVSPSSS